MNHNNQRPDSFSRPDEWRSWQDEPQQNHGDAAGTRDDARPAQRDETTTPQPEPYRSVDVDPSWAPPSVSYQQAAPQPVARVKRRSDVPVVTWTLIGTCFLVWVGELLSPQVSQAVVSPTSRVYRAVAIRHLNVRARTKHFPHWLQYVRAVGPRPISGALSRTRQIPRRLPHVWTGWRSAVLSDGHYEWEWDDPAER